MSTDQVPHTRRFLIPGPNDDSSTKFILTVTFLKNELWEFLTSDSPATMLFYMLLIPLTLWTWAPEFNWALRKGLFFGYKLKPDHHPYEDWADPYDDEDDLDAPWDVRFKRGLFQALLGPDQRQNKRTEEYPIIEEMNGRPNNTKKHVYSANKYLHTDESINQATMFFRSDGYKNIRTAEQCNHSGNVSKTNISGRRVTVRIAKQNSSYNDEVFGRAVAYFNTKGEGELSRDFAEKRAANKSINSSFKKTNSNTGQRGQSIQAQGNGGCSDGRNCPNNGGGNTETKDHHSVSEHKKAVSSPTTWLQRVKGIFSPVRHLINTSSINNCGQKSTGKVILNEEPSRPSGLLQIAIQTLCYGSYRHPREEGFFNANIKNIQQRSMTAQLRGITTIKGNRTAVHPRLTQPTQFVPFGRTDIEMIRMLKHQCSCQITELANAHQAEIKALHESYQRRLTKQEMTFIDAAKNLESEKAQIVEMHRAEMAELKKRHMEEFLKQEASFVKSATSCGDEVEQLRAEHKATIDRLNEDHIAKFSAQEKYYAEVARGYNQEKDELLQTHKTDVEDMQQVHDQEFLAQEEYYKRSLKEPEIYENAINRVATNIDSARVAEIKALHVQYDAKYIAQEESFMERAKQLNLEKAEMVKAHEAEIANLHEMYGAQLKAQKNVCGKAPQQQRVENRKEEAAGKHMKLKNPELIRGHEGQIKELTAIYEARMAKDRKGYEDNVVKILRWHDEQMESLRVALTKEGKGGEAVENAIGVAGCDWLNADGEVGNEDNTASKSQPEPEEKEKLTEDCSGDDWDGETEPDSENEVVYKPALKTEASHRTRRVAFREQISEEKIFAHDKFETVPGTGYKPGIKCHEPGSKPEMRASAESLREVECSGRTSRLSFNDTDEDSYASDEWDSESDYNSDIEKQPPLKVVSGRRIKKPRVTIPDSDSEASETSSCDEYDLGSDCSSDVPVEPPIKPTFKTRAKEPGFYQSDSDESDWEEEFRVAIKQKQPLSEVVTGGEEHRGAASQIELWTESERKSHKKSEELIRECKKLKDPWAPENLPKFSDKYTPQQKEWLNLYVLHQIVTVPTVHPGRYIEIDGRYATRQDEEAFATLFKN